MMKVYSSKELEGPKAIITDAAEQDLDNDDGADEYLAIVAKNVL